MNEKWHRLRQLIRDEALLEGDFALASGEKSSIYLDVRTIALHPEGLCLISDILYGELRHELHHPGIQAIGGAFSPGVAPIVGAMVSKSYREGRPIPGFLEQKGKIYGMPIAGKKVVIIEDVVNTGGSVLNTIHYAESQGAEVVDILCVVDRGDRSTELLNQRGYGFYCIFEYSEFV